MYELVGKGLLSRQGAREFFRPKTRQYIRTIERFKQREQR
jgi:hypothetical protein